MTQETINIEAYERIGRVEGRVDVLERQVGGHATSIDNLMTTMNQMLGAITFIKHLLVFAVLIQSLSVLKDHPELIDPIVKLIKAFF